MDQLRQIVTDPVTFSHALLPTIPLRSYQTAPVRDVAAAIEQRDGQTLTWVFSRQSGKDEALAQLLAYLLVRYQRAGGSIVVAAPTLDPQARITYQRLRDRLDNARALTRTTRTAGSMTVRVGKASVTFVSAQEQANQRGLTASLLLVANEAQDIDTEIWDARFAPMTASTNAPTLFMGTVWDANSLLSRQRRLPPPARHHTVTWRTVAQAVPAYGAHVRTRIAQLGEDHPYIRTEYDLIELDSEASLFGSVRLEQLKGSHQRKTNGHDGGRYGLLVDVAGSDEQPDHPGQTYDPTSKRDSTTAIAVEILHHGPNPSYQIVDRIAWTGANHTILAPQLADLATTVWRARYLAIDRTGLGLGLSQMITRELAGKRIHVVPLSWTSATKSRAAWELMALIDTGRLKDYDTADQTDEITRRLYAELVATRGELLPGPGKLIRWGVPTGQGHDDLVMALALLPFVDEIVRRPRIAAGSGPETPPQP